MPSAVSVTRRSMLQPSAPSGLATLPEVAPPRGTVVVATTVVGAAAPATVVDVAAGSMATVVVGATVGAPVTDPLPAATTAATASANPAVRIAAARRIGAGG